MNDHRFDPQRIFEALAQHDVEYVAIGGMAAAAHGSRRATFDVDIMPAPDPANYERLAAAIESLGAPETAIDETFQAVDLRDDVDLARASIVRVSTAVGDLDVMNVVKGASPYEDLAARASSVDVRGVRVRVVSLDDLIAMKRASGRPQDLRDIAELTAT